MRPWLCSHRRQGSFGQLAHTVHASTHAPMCGSHRPSPLAHWGRLSLLSAVLLSSNTAGYSPGSTCHLDTGVLELWIVITLLFPGFCFWFWGRVSLCSQGWPLSSTSEGGGFRCGFLCLVYGWGGSKPGWCACQQAPHYTNYTVASFSLLQFILNWINDNLLS